MSKPRRRRRRKAIDNDAAPPTPRSGEYATDAVVDVEGSTIEEGEQLEQGGTALEAPVDADVDDIVAAIVSAEPDGPTLEPDDEGGLAPGEIATLEIGPGGDITATVDVPGFFEAMEDFATGLDRTFADARSVGAVCVQLERLVALVIGMDAEVLRTAYHFEVFPDDDPKRGKLGMTDVDEHVPVVLVCRLEPGSLYLKTRAGTLAALLRGLRPSAGLGALVQALWNEQQAIELGRKLEAGDPGEE